jgi:LuxR family maltose regulon positive regulatory protein
MSMATPVLVTKLFIPTPRPAFVARPRLIDLLNEGLRGSLTVVSAPAGFGKSTLLSAWAASVDRSLAWVSLDEADSDPARFLTYLVAGLRTAVPGLGEQLLGVLQSGQPPSIEAVLIALLNEISALSHPVVLVLDDYHAVDAAEVDSAVTFLLEHGSPLLHLVISSRQDPSLPLARLRARGQLTEVRAADLRFGPTEVADYLSSAMGLTLTVKDIDTLGRRTEGWIAGLQLAALSLREHADASGFIKDFAGDHRYIADYLVGEVLSHQSSDVRRFLLSTAVLDHLNGSLCDAVTGQDNGGQRLDALDRGNFFVVPLDDRRQWYRYHHLFAEVLRAYLVEERPDEVAVLHRRASEWFERNGSLADAVRHALAGEDFGRAADLVEQAAPALSQARQEATLLAWLRALPEEVFRNRPVLNASYAGVLLACGLLSEVDARLGDAASWLEPNAPVHDRIVVNEQGFRELPGAIAMWRAGSALMHGDEVGTRSHAERALELSSDEDHLTRGGAAGLLALISWGKGDLDGAFAGYTECVGHLRSVGSFADVVGCSITLADVRVAQGRLRDALDIYQSGLELASPSGGPALRGAADMHIGISTIRCEQGDLDGARRHLMRAEELGESLGLPQNPYRLRVAKARLQQIAGDFDGAVELLHEAERVYDNDFSPKVRPVAAIKARVLVLQGKLDDAVRWAHDHKLSEEDELSYVREFEYLTLARVMLAQGQLGKALDLLERLLPAAEQGGRTGSVLEILVLRALGHQSHGDTQSAVTSLARALVLAEPEGYERLFIDAGPPMTALLRAAAEQGTTPAYAGRLLALGGTSYDHVPAQRGVIDPLSERELDVLRLLGTDLSGPEIARELVVSLHTVRSHTKSIYTKLGVNTRRAAVREAGDLRLLASRRA